MDAKNVAKGILEPLGLIAPAKKAAFKLGLYDYNCLSGQQHIDPKVRTAFAAVDLTAYHHTAICSYSGLPEEFIRQLKQLGIFQHFRYLIIDDKHLVSKVKYYYGLRVLPFNQSVKADCIVIGDPIYQAALAAKLRYTFSDKLKIINPFKIETVYATSKLIENKYVHKGGEAKDEESWNKRRQDMTHQQDAIDAYVEAVIDHVPLFQRIEIETLNRCNGECSFCPVNRHLDPRPLKKMDEALFKKIVKELHDLNYSGHVAVYSNNEPLIDARNVEFNEYLRAQVPNAKIYMHTNGTLLTEEKFLRLIAVLDELIIDNYNDSLELLPAAKIVQDYCKMHPEAIQKVTIAMRKQNEILTTRGGAAPNRSEKISYADRRCSLPFRQMVIRPDGKLSLCCNDALGTKTLGDLTRQTMVEAWYGPAYQSIRKQIYDGRKNIDICKYCDEFHITDM